MRAALPKLVIPEVIRHMHLVLPPDIVIQPEVIAVIHQKVFTKPGQRVHQ